MLTDDERKTINHAADVLGPSLRDLATRLRAIAAPRVATVGELLGTAPIGEVVEMSDGSQFRWIDGMRTGTGRVEARTWHSGAWSDWSPSVIIVYYLRAAARIVPASDADRDPSVRGPVEVAS